MSAALEAMREMERDRTRRRLQEVQRNADPMNIEAHAFLQLAEVAIRYLDMLELGASYPSYPPKEVLEEIRYHEHMLRMVLGWPEKPTQP